MGTIDDILVEIADIKRADIGSYEIYDITYHRYEKLVTKFIRYIEDTEIRYRRQWTDLRVLFVSEFSDIWFKLTRTVDEFIVDLYNEIGIEAKAGEFIIPNLAELRCRTGSYENFNELHSEFVHLNQASTRLQVTPAQYLEPLGPPKRDGLSYEEARSLIVKKKKIYCMVTGRKILPTSRLFYDIIEQVPHETGYWTGREFPLYDTKTIMDNLPRKLEEHSYDKKKKAKDIITQQ